MNIFSFLGKITGLLQPLNQLLDILGKYVFPLLMGLFTGYYFRIVWIYQAKEDCGTDIACDILHS
jgi:hypothetical protein